MHETQWQEGRAGIGFRPPGMGRVENFVLGALGARRGHVGKIFWLLSRCVMGHKLLAESLGVAQGVSLRVGLPMLLGWIHRSLSSAWGSFMEPFCGLLW